MDLATYITQLVDERFVKETLTPEVKGALQGEALERLSAFLQNRMIEAFTEEDLGTFEQLLQEKRSLEELQAFAKQRIPQFDLLMTNSLHVFREEYLL
jgi:hypothetical protein